MATFIPFIHQDIDGALVSSLARIGPLLVPASYLDQAKKLLPTGSSFLVLVDETDTLCRQDDVVSWLDQGAEKVILPLSWTKELIGSLPRERLVLLLDVAGVSAISDTLREGVSGVFLRMPTADLDLVGSVSRFFTSPDVYVHVTSNTTPSLPTLREVHGAKATLVLPTSQLTLGPSSNTQINISDAFTSVLSTDRPDGLFPTVVSSWLHGGKSLGLVYSSRESIKESIITGKGVYQSRKHGLWRKGETSGATQDVIQIRLDCDADCLEFTVVQHGTGFCHLERASCFGHLSGLAALQSTLQSRLESAPEGSYTQRLFRDPSLLNAKIREEADELCQAQTKEDIAAEAADLFYFALAKCVASGVSIVDVEKYLDARSRKVTRRPGNAKPQYISDAQKRPVEVHSGSASTPSADAPIRTRTYDLTQVNKEERSQLLKRPVIKSEEMIAKVKPIVDMVRTKGDAALLELTAKFDKAQLTSPIVQPPFAADLLLGRSVREAIDVAYANIYKFHSAQLDKGTLVVETSPGVVCSRFARPISRVGLYVPGGTAILPSTALMLGVPAQVAGCEEIVLATPPRADGSISPEVLYAAHLVGASAILKAGGAQAVAALAYGTETVPKVDKIFGPGNQWVTAAKMLVQNDTDALVSIDMPAGPSEVLASDNFRVHHVTLC